MTNISFMFGFFLCVGIFCRFLYYHEIWYSSLYINNGFNLLAFNVKCISSILYLCCPLLTVASFDIIFVWRWFPTFTLCLPLLINFSIHNFLVSSNGLFFSTYKISFSISCKVGQVVLNSLSFCLSVKLLISPSSLNEGLSV